MLKNIDIVDNNNQLTGSESTIDHAMKKGLWHRGAHIIVYTKTGYVLVQKRSSTMVTHPGYLDISCGGFVDAGETPEIAAVRELKEELGIHISTQELSLLEVRRKNHAWPRTKRYDRTFLYCYAVCLPDHHMSLSHLQKEEVESAQFLTFREANRLITRHHIQGLGRIEPLYGFYRTLLGNARTLASQTVQS